jgi:hypothetical protein
MFRAAYDEREPEFDRRVAAGQASAGDELLILRWLDPV